MNRSLKADSLLKNSVHQYGDAGVLFWKHHSNMAAALCSLAEPTAIPSKNTQRQNFKFPLSAEPVLCYKHHVTVPHCTLPLLYYHVHNFATLADHLL